MKARLLEKINTDYTGGRIAIVDQDKCKPDKCGLECKNSCPANKMLFNIKSEKEDQVYGKICIDVKRTDKIAKISELLCIGCGICVRKCPFEAIKVINLPTNIPNEISHRLGPNKFALFRLPAPRQNSILGIMGSNGIGKTTALRILTKNIIPNFGNFEVEPSWETLMSKYKGSEIQAYFSKILNNDYKSAFKIQFVDQIPKVATGLVRLMIEKRDQRKLAKELIPILQLESLLDREIRTLSGGELQRFAILITLLQEANVFVFDEPTSYLDIKQRLIVSDAIRQYGKYRSEQNYVIVVEHDLSILDYLSDRICCFYGKPGAFGVVSLPYAAKEGINVFLDGFLTKDNMHIREKPITFNRGQFAEDQEIMQKNDAVSTMSYPGFTKKFPGFTLQVEPGSYKTSQVTLLLGENGTGKTTLIRILAGQDKEIDAKIPEIKVSYKPQIFSATYEGYVQDLLYTRIKSKWKTDSQFKSTVVDRMNIEPLLLTEVKKLSGGEMQRVGLVVALGRDAEVYLIDEPSAYLDIEQRIISAKAIKKYLMLSFKTAFVVEHDFIMATYLADQVVLFEGEPGKNCRALSPTGLVEGINRFLKTLGITFRRDKSNFRPQLNKFESVLDREQKQSGNFYF